MTQEKRKPENSSNEERTELLLENFNTKKSPSREGFTGGFFQTYKEELTPDVHKLFQKIKENSFLSFYEVLS